MFSLVDLEWPPIPVAYGWKDGKIAIARADLHEDESPNGRYVNTFDETKGHWSTRQAGIARSGDKHDNWWERMGFDILVSVRHRESDRESHIWAPPS